MEVTMEMISGICSISHLIFLVVCKQCSHFQHILSRRTQNNDTYCSAMQFIVGACLAWDMEVLFIIVEALLVWLRRSDAIVSASYLPKKSCKS